MRRSLFAFFLIVAAPLAAGADLCDGTTRVPVRITSGSGDPSDLIPPGSYCFDAAVADNLVSKNVVIQWFHQRGDQAPLPSATGQATTDAGAKKAKASVALEAATKRKDDAAHRRDAAKQVVETLARRTKLLRQKKMLSSSEVDEAFDAKERLSEAKKLQNDAEQDLARAQEDADQALLDLRSAPTAEVAIPPHAVTLDSGDKAIMKVWIDAKDTQGNPTRTYTFEVETGGKWQLGYGFLFMPGHDKEYVSRAADSGFVIARKSNRNALTFAPGLIWSWYPNPSRTSSCVFGGFRCGFAAGIAADSSSPILFAGVQGTYHQNISFNLGVAVHQEKRLAGEYHEGQSLTESIDSDTLNKSVYRPNLYFGVSFRFDKSPF